MNALRSYRAMVYWEWVREMKRKETIVSMLLFSLTTLMVFSFAIPPQSETGVEARSGVLWVTCLLAGTIGVDRAFRGRGEERVLQGLLISPVGRITIYYARLTATFLWVLAMAAATFVIFCLLYNVSLSPAQVLQVAAGGGGLIAGLVIAGVTLSAMTRSIRGGDVMLRILLLPLLIPIFFAVVRITDLVFHGEEVTWREVVVIVAFDAVYLAAGQLLFEHVVAEFE